jgi:hypothetical protein
MLSARNFRLVFTLASVTFLSLMFVRPAFAQCDYNPFGFQGAAVEPNNPLQAEYSTTGLLRNFIGDAFLASPDKQEHNFGYSENRHGHA